MISPRRHFFTVHELLILATLAALGGVSSTVLSIPREMSHSIPGLGTVRQAVAGIHVLWLVIAVGLIRKPGVATITGLLKAAVELLSGNPLGPIVFAYSAAAGLGVDAVWMSLRRRDHLVVYMVAGAVGTATNPWVLGLLGIIPCEGGGWVVLLGLSQVALVSGAILAGLLGWQVLRAVRKAGVTGAHPHS